MVLLKLEFLTIQALEGLIVKDEEQSLLAKICPWSKLKKNLVLGLTQENSVENSVQDCLPYIPRLMVCATTAISLP